MASVGQEIGSSGLTYGFGGVVAEERHPNLQGGQAMKVWREMSDNDALVGAILLAIDMLIRQVEWDVEQKDATEEDTEFLKSCMDDMSQAWGDVISEALSMIPFGFAFHEIVYKRRSGYQKSGSKIPSSKYDDGKIGWRKMPLRAQESLVRWEMDDDGGIQGFVQRTGTALEQEVVIPMEKGLLFRTRAYKNNPEGRSLLRHAYVSWFYKKRLQAIEGTGIERDLAGFPVFWLPADHLAAEAPAEKKRVVQAFMELGQNIRRDKQEYMIMPLEFDDSGHKMYDFTLTASAGTRTFDLNSTISRYNQEIAMSILADFILLGHEKVGSFALSSDKTDLFAVALGTVLDSIADVFNRHAVTRLFELNGLDVKNLPEIVHRDIEDPDLTSVGSFITSLSSAGAPLFPDDELEAWLRSIAGMPERTEEAKAAQEAKAAAAAAPAPGAETPPEEAEEDAEPEIVDEDSPVDFSGIQW